MNINFLQSNQTTVWLKTVLIAALLTTSCSTDSEQIDLLSNDSSALSAESVELPIHGIISDTEQDEDSFIELAIDDDEDSKWLAFGEEINVDLDLNNIQLVDFINISFFDGDDKAHEFEVFALVNGSFERIGGATSSGTNTRLITYDLTNTETNSLRIVFRGNDEDLANGVNDIEVWGTLLDRELVPESNQNAFITDTSDADTGELRLNLSETVAVGTMSVTISKEATQNGFINLSGASTSRPNALIDMRINDSNGYEFTESGDSVNAFADFPDFVNDELVEVVISWDATNAAGPTVLVTIDGQAVTSEAFLSESQDPSSIADGVRTVQFRLGGNSSFDDSGAGMLVDNLKVYDTSSGTPVIVFEDDFESYTAGNSLDPDAATANVAPILDAISDVSSPYRNNSFQVTVQGDVEPIVEGPVSLQNAFITDTSDADTGELRLNLNETVAVGMMSVTISKDATQNGFVNLSGASTSRPNALIDMRINDSSGYQFTESGDSVNAIADFPDFVNNELVELVISWNATNEAGPSVFVTIDGQAVTSEAFLSESLDPSSIAAGVRTVQFRLGGNSSFDATGAGMLVDNLKVYDLSSGTPVIVFEDDFESYTAGNSLDPDAATAIVAPIADAIFDTTSPYRNNSFQVIVQGEGDGTDPVIIDEPIEVDPIDFEPGKEDIIKSSPFGFNDIFVGDDFQVDNDGDGAHNWNAREYDEEPFDNGFDVTDFIFVTDNRLILQSPNSLHNENENASRRRAEYRDQEEISLDDAHSMDFVFDIENYDNSSELIMAQLHNDNTGARRPYITVLAEDGEIRSQRTNAPTGSRSLRSEEVIPFRIDSRYRITIESAAGDRSIYVRIINLTTGEQSESTFEFVEDWSPLNGDFYWKFGAYMPDGGSTNTRMRMESIEITGQQ